MTAVQLSNLINAIHSRGLSLIEIDYDIIVHTVFILSQLYIIKYRIPFTSFSFSSISLVLNFFCTSLINLKAVLRLEDGAYSSPGSFVFELLYVL